MALEQYIVKSGSSGSSSLVTLYHGSALQYCQDIRDHGVDYEKLRQAFEGAYAFCASRSFNIAKEYALMNPLVRMEGHTAGVIKFVLANARAEEWVAKMQARWVVPDQAYEFEAPATFPIINLERTDVAVRVVTQMTMTFEEGALDG